MPKVSSLWIEISARSAKFLAGLKKTEASAKGWSARVKKSITVLKPALGIVSKAVTALGAALAAVYVAQSKWIDQTAKQAAKLGDLTANLQAVRYAADFAGVGDQIDTAMQRLTRRMAEAANGTGEALKAVQQLGINAGEVANKTATEQLQVVLDKLAEIPPGAERVRLAFKFFDSEGVGIVNLTSDAIRQAREELDRWGYTINEQQAAWVEAANDQMSRLSKFAGAGAKQFASKLSPVIGAVTKQIIEMAEKTINWASLTDKAVWLVTKGIEGVQALADAVLLLWDGFSFAAKRSVEWVLKAVLVPLEQGIARVLNLIPESLGGVKIDPEQMPLVKALRFLEKESMESAESFRERWDRLSTIVSTGGLGGSAYSISPLVEQMKRDAEEAKRVQIELQESLRLGLQSNVIQFPGPDSKKKGKKSSVKSELSEMEKAAERMHQNLLTIQQRISQGIIESADRGKKAVQEMVADVIVQLARIKIEQYLGLSGEKPQSKIGSFVAGLASNFGIQSFAPAADNSSLSRGAAAAGYSSQVINVWASGDSQSSLAQTRAAVRSLKDNGPADVAARASRGGAYAAAVGMG